MAKCEKRVVQPDPPPVEYVLTLTQSERAIVLVALYSMSRDAFPLSWVVAKALELAGD